jgi:hypothetical protein
MLPEDKKAAAMASCTKTVELSDRNACDVELLTIGYVSGILTLTFFNFKHSFPSWPS